VSTRAVDDADVSSTPPSLLGTVKYREGARFLRHRHTRDGVITALSAFASRPSFGFCNRRSPELELIALRNQVIVRPVRCGATTLLAFWLQ